MYIKAMKIWCDMKNPQCDVEFFKALAHPARLEILYYLKKGPACANRTNEAIRISQPNLSQHLQKLKEAGLVDCRVEGPKRCYFICRVSLVDKILKLLNEPHPYEQCALPEQN